MGIVKLKDAEGYNLSVWDGENWTRGDILYSGKKQKCIVTLSTGQKFICSPIHKFSVIDYDENISEVSNGKKFVECKDLKKGIKIECNTKSDLSILSKSSRKVSKIGNLDISVLVESVEITDEYIDMYDVCNTERGYYVADGLITHNTAADIYKQSVNNMFVRICKEGWLGKVLINGFIHDEMLIEVHKSINPYYFFKVWRDEFEVRPAHYCKLYAGAGVGKCWYDAKKLDLPPLYIQEIIDQYQEGMPWNENFDDFLVDVKKGFKQHKINRIRDYITDESSQGEIIKPAISSLLGDEMDNVISGVIEDDSKLEQLNSILEKNKIEKGKKNKISGLQEQLKAFCYYYGVDYSKIDIKSPDDVSVIQNNTNDMEDSDEDEVVIQVDKSQLLEVGLISNGIIADYETMTVHMGELMLRSKDKFIKGTAHFIQKDLIVKQTEDMSNQQCYKIKYYPNLKGEHPKGVIIDGYVIPKDNLPVLLHFYKEMISRQYAFLVNR